jgi:hypothetical protein
MSKILRRRTADGRIRRRLEPGPTVTVILRRRTADGRIRRTLRYAAASATSVNVVAPAALESLSGQRADNGALLEWLVLLPEPVRVPLERLLASPGKRRLLSTPGRLRVGKRL